MDCASNYPYISNSIHKAILGADMSASIAISLSQPIDGNRSSRPEQLTAPGGNFDLPHINQNGSYAFDEVIKRGVLKLRVRKRGVSSRLQAILHLNCSTKLMYDSGMEGHLEDSVHHFKTQCPLNIQ